LAAVSWIDPNLVGLTAIAANDDHPPADVMAAQEMEIFMSRGGIIVTAAWAATSTPTSRTVVQFSNRGEGQRLEPFH
jgi:hypothetical protein